MNDNSATDMNKFWIALVIAAIAIITAVVIFAAARRGTQGAANMVPQLPAPSGQP